VGNCRLDVRAYSNLDLGSATFASLSFTNQKYCVHGEAIDFGRGGILDCYPFQCTFR
jgi:hypothetical protein